jgi:hypothetical protein
MTPLINHLRGSRNHFEEPYKTHLQVQMVEYICHELGVSISHKVGGKSSVVIDYQGATLSISSQEVKVFVTQLTSGTLDNKRSRLNGLKKILDRLRDIPGDELNSDCTQFLAFGEELFKLLGQEVLSVSLERGTMVEMSSSVRYKRWKPLEDLGRLCIHFLDSK